MFPSKPYNAGIEKGLSKQIEGDAEIAEELQDGDKSDTGTENQD